MFATRLSDALEVLGLFLIPIGGGIPAGVILAKNRAIDWPTTSALYLVSDIILACLFEPLLLLFALLAKKSPFLTRWAQAYKATATQVGFREGLKPTPLSLIAFSFGIDPMTGRALARAAGHGFLSGWAIAICGDMFFFALIMASTLFLNDLFGDGTWAAVVVMLLMIGLSMAFRRFGKESPVPQGS